MIGLLGCRGTPEDKDATTVAGTTTETQLEMTEIDTHAEESVESHAEHGPVVPVTDEETGKILYWTCVMHPSVRMPEPGTCPVCSMDLIPVYEGEGLTLTARQQDLIPIRTEKIGFHTLEREIRTVGNLDYDETRVAYVSTRVSGWIERLYINFTGTQVKQGEHLLHIYSPELLVAQEEYLLTIKNLSEIQGSHLASIRDTSEQTLQAAEQRLELLGLTKQQIREIREYGKVRTELPLYAPVGGTVIHLNVNQGQYVNRGAHLYKIADLSNLWLLADIYEYEMPWISLGQDVEITVQSMPGKKFHGKVIFIYPYMDTKTRTIRLQVEVPNPAGELRPGMYANVRLKSTLAQIYSQRPEIQQTRKSEILVDSPTGPPVSIWTCPMHPQIQRDEPGECPICGMTLIEKEVSPASKEASPASGESTEQGTNPAPLVLRPDAPPLQFRYACLDHPDTVYDAPGTCPEDGKSLMMLAEVLSVPKSAVIDTGLRTVVFVDKGDSVGYVQTEVKLGPEAWSEENGERRRYFPIISGLFAGDVVVTNGNYLLDSQTQLTGSAAGAYGGALGKEESESGTAPAHQH